MVWYGRELVMAQIRVQITTMYEHLEIIKQTRLGEEDDDNAWYVVVVVGV